MRQRDKRGRFAEGNTISRRGWLALVEKHFDGDVAAARAYVGQLGFHTYARAALIGTPNEHKLRSPNYAHPGAPQQFYAAWCNRLNFDLSQVEELPI